MNKQQALSLTSSISLTTRMRLYLDTGMTVLFLFLRIVFLSQERKTRKQQQLLLFVTPLLAPALRQTTHIPQTKSVIHLGLYFSSKTIIERIAKKNALMCIKYWFHAAVVRVMLDFYNKRLK